MSEKSYYSDEKEVISALMKYQKEGFILDQVSEKGDGVNFYSFSFSYNGRDGGITIYYDSAKKSFARNANHVVGITLNCKFGKAASPNNNEGLEDLALHVLDLFSKL